MERTEIYFNKKIRPSRPILIVGLPGIGSVGSLVGENLRKEFKAKRYASIFSPHFLHMAVMQKSGGVRFISNKIYHFQIKPAKQDVLVLVGDTQAITSQGQYEVNERIVKFFKKIGGEAIYTIGGYNITNQEVKNPKVFGVSTSEKFKKALKEKGVIFGEATGMILGSAGLIPIFAKKHKIDAACIMGETGPLMVDANAAKAVLKVLSNVLNVNIKANEIEKIRKEVEKASLADPMQKLENPQPPMPTEHFTYIR